MFELKKIGSYVKFFTKGITPKYVSNSSLMVLNQKCIRHNTIDYSYVQYCDENKKPKDSKIIKVGDILINSTGQGTAGRSAFIREIPDGITLTVDSHILIIRARSYDEARCISYLLYFYEKEIQTFMDGSTGQGELDRVRLFNIKIPLPKNPKNQIQAGNFLDLIGSKIKVNEEIIQTLKTMSKLIYDYWLIQYEFPNHVGKPYKSSNGDFVWNNVVKRNIPKGWTVVNLLDIAEYQNGLPCQKYRPDDGGKLRVIKIKEMNDGYSINTEFVTDKVHPKYIVNNGDILFSWSASLAVMMWSGGTGVLNQHIFKVTSNKFPKPFYYFELLNYLSHFKMMAENRKTTMGHITQDHLLQSKIILPPKEIIESISAIISPNLEKIILLESQNFELKKLRDFLLPILITEKITIQ